MGDDVSEQAKGLAERIREGKLDLEVVCRLYLQYRDEVAFYKKAYEDLTKLAEQIELKMASLRLRVMRP